MSIVNPKKSKGGRGSLGIFKILLKNEKPSLLLPSECLPRKISEKSKEYILGNFYIFAFISPKMYHPLKIQTVTSAHFLMLVIWLNFRKI